MKIKIFKVITVIAWIIFIFSLLAFDSKELTIPLCGLVSSTCWLSIMMTANSVDLDNPDKKRDKKEASASQSRRLKL